MAGDYGGDDVEEIRRRKKKETQGLISGAVDESIKEAGVPRRRLPSALNELGPPGSSSGLHGSAGEGSYDLAKAKKRKARRAKIAAMRTEVA